MAIHISSWDCAQTAIPPAQDEHFTRRELSELLGGEIQILRLTDKRQKTRIEEFMIIADAPDTPVNEVASAMAGATITGDVILARPHELDWRLRLKLT